VTGILVPEGDDAAFVDAILRLASNESERAALGEAGKKFVTTSFVPERAARSMINALL
jgi:glycosyltransferase involved in cell wall biosynthesis